MKMPLQCCWVPEFGPSDSEGPMYFKWPMPFILYQLHNLSSPNTPFFLSRKACSNNHYVKSHNVYMCCCTHLLSMIVTKWWCSFAALLVLIILLRCPRHTLSSMEPFLNVEKTVYVPIDVWSNICFGSFQFWSFYQNASIIIKWVYVLTFSIASSLWREKRPWSFWDFTVV